MRHIFKNNKFYCLILVCIVLFFVIVSPVKAADSGLGGSVAKVVGWIIYPIIAFVGWLASFVISTLLQVASFSKIIDADPVVKGWVIVRDLCNMFFILILLVVAFATILRIETYQWKKILPKLLIMAVLINFSKTICGLIIDFAQVIMLTFVNGFGAGAGNFVDTLGIKNFLSFTSDNTKAVDFTTTLASVIAALFFSIIVLITVTVILVVLVMRIIMLWIYVILSPIAFLAAAFPAGQKYASQWWGEFSKNVIVGPVLAFFIWLALSTAKGAGNLISPAKECKDSGGLLISLMCNDTFTTFVISIGMLVGGLMVTQQIGGIAGSIAGKGMAAINKGGGMVVGGAKDLGFTAGRKLDQLQMNAQRKIFGGKGKEFYAKSLNYSAIKKGWDASRAQALEKYEGGGDAGVPISAPYHDLTNKWFSLNQYKTWRKGKPQQDADRAKASRLGFDADRSEERLRNADLLQKEDRDVQREKYRENYIKRRDDFIKNAPPELKDEKEKLAYAVQQLSIDDLSLNEPAKLDRAKDEAIIKNNRAEAEGLEDVRATIFGKKWGKNLPGEDYTISKRGADEAIDKKTNEMRRKTGDNSGAIVEEVLKAFNKGETNDVIAGFRVLTQNNDINDAMKDKRVINLMTRSNGLLEKLAKSGKVDGLNSSNADALKSDFRNNPVTPAYAQAMMQGMLSELGVNDKMSARTMAGIGEMGIAKGNGLTFAAAMTDEISGGHTFDKMNFSDGTLNSSAARKRAIVGKLNTFESQAKMRLLHPNNWFAEAADGTAAFLTKEGEELLRNLNGQDMGQINRMRPDNFKAARNPKVMRQIMALAKKVEGEGNENQAKLIKYFGGYLLTKLEGGVKDMDGTIKDFDKEYS